MALVKVGTEPRRARRLQPRRRRTTRRRTALTTMKRPTATRPPRTANRAVRVAAPAPRNPVAAALAARRTSGAAGRHGPQASARRAAERAALVRELRSARDD